MTSPITFYVPGIPRPKGSGRAFKSATNGKVYIKSDCRHLKGWERDVRTMAQTVRPRCEWTGPVVLTATFVLPKPKTVTRDYPAVKPDIDKLLRGAVDGLTGVIFKDDAQIITAIARKRYGTQAEAGVHFTLEQVR